MKHIILITAALGLGACSQAPETPKTNAAPENTFSFIGKITLQDGARSEFNTLMQEAFAGMNDCISCMTLLDVKDPNVIWVSETWPSRAAHDAVLDDPDLQAVFAKGRPMITKMQRMAEVGE